MRLRKIMCCLGMLIGVVGCSSPKPEPTLTDYITICVNVQFQIDYEDCEIITIHTMDLDPYYITDIHYRKEFDNNVYKTEYISSVNDSNELVVKEVLL